jgi:hypothetical protein
VEVGEVLRIDDAITGFDRNKSGRPCIVVRLDRRPRAGAWVLPRSTTGNVGTSVPAGALPGLNQPGRFMYLPHFVSAADLAGCPSLGVLGEPHRQRVLDNVNEVAIDLEEEL